MAITAEARTDIIALVVGMFDAAPGATYLSQFVNSMDAGSTIETLAADLTGTSAFTNTYPDLQTANEFATKFVNNIAPEAGTAAKAWAVTWIEAQLNGGATKAEVIVASINALRATDEADANWGNAAAALNNKVEVAEWYSVDQLGNATDLATLQNQISTVTSDDATVTAITDGSAQSGQTFSLTDGIDDVTGTAGNDTIVGLIDVTTPANTTVNALDSVTGGDGTDTMTLNVVGDYVDAGVPAGVTISGVETVNVRASGDLGDTTGDFDFSGVSGLNDLNITLADDVFAEAAATTDVSISGTTGVIDVDGGKDVTVTDSTAAKTITIGDATATTGDPAGAISVTDTNNSGANNIVITGGTDVTVTTTADKASSGTITVGHAANGQASGAVSVTQNTTSDGTAATAGNVTVTGGATINVTANITNTATAGNGANITAGTITANAGDTTTAVTLTQNNTANDLAAVTTGNATETASVKFGVLKSGDAITISVNGDAVADAGELTFTAAKDLTADEVAAAFANLTNGDTQTAGQVTNGVFTGAIAGWTSAAASGDTVVFTSTTADSNIANNLDTALTNTSGNSVDATVTTTDGSAGTTVAAQDVTATDGAVVVQDNATASVTTVTLDGFNGATLGTTGSLDALTDLSLKDGAGTATLRTAQSSLNVSLDGMAATSALNLDHTAATVETLNLTTTGAASDVDLTAAAVTTANITAGANLDLSGGTFANVETVTVTGAGDVNLGDISAATEALTATSATGAITATVDGTKAVTTTGSGNDAITVNTAGISKAINLGAGDDTLTLSAATASVPTAAVAGGEGTDTVAMTRASALSLDANTNFQTAITGFERLTVTDAVQNGDTIDLEALGFNYVTLAAGTTGAGTVTLDNMANAGTLVMGAAGAATATQVNVKDAATTDATLNIVVSNDSTIALGTITADEVETINIQASDVFVDANEDGDDDNNAVHTLTLDADAVTSVVVTGDDLTLDTNSTVLTSVDASAVTGGISYTADGAAAGTTVTGGAGTDALVANGSNDVLLGGAGNDTLTGADLTTLTGGAGNDTFNMNVATNVNSYSTITDASAGDVIDLDAGNAGTVVFTQAAITLADTAVFQDYANAAANAHGTDGNNASWFQFGGNTYIVQSGNTTANNDFVNNSDAIIQLTGAVDLSTASYNQSNGTLEIV